MTKLPMKRILALFPSEMVTEIDAFQARHKITTQAEAIRTLVRSALDADKPKKRAALSPDEAAALVVLEKLRSRLGDADAAQTMNRLWHVMVDWQEREEAEIAAKEQQPPEKPAKPSRGTKLRSWFI
jgi:hypothetical protein